MKKHLHHYTQQAIDHVLENYKTHPGIGAPTVRWEGKLFSADDRQMLTMKVRAAMWTKENN